MIKKADIILFFIILIGGLAISWFSISGSITGEKVLISVDGEEYGVYSLYEDREIDIEQNGHHNHITISNGTVSMTFSDCKNQVCVNDGKISQTKDSIVCLPNKVLVEIIGGNDAEGGGADVISG